MDPLDPFAGLKKAKKEYNVYDSHYEKIGKVDDLLVDENDRVVYIGVKMGFFGRNSTIVPTEIIRVNDRRELIEISEPAESIKHAPHFGHGEELNPELENHVRSYYGLEGLKPTPEHDPQGHNVPGTDRLGPDPRVDIVPGERTSAQERDLTERPATPSRHPVDIPLDDVPEYETPGREASEHETAERPTARRLPSSTEPSSREPDGRWETEDAGAVRVHRLRR